MSKEFNTMSADEKQALIKQMGTLLQEHEIDASVVTMTEVVCAVAEKKIEHKVVLQIKKEMPSSESEKAKKFNEAAKPLVEGITGVTLEVVSKLGAGDMYQEITKVTKMGSEENTSIVHNQGDVILIDFWATWCPPCQAPMQHNQEMLEKNSALWGNNVRIVGLSIDQSAELMSKHVIAKKWQTVEHYHRNESDCSQVYGVRGVPHVILINKEGRMVFKGHPATRKNLEEDITKLSKGEQLEGEGIVNGPVAGEDAEKPKEDAEYKEIDAATIDKEIEDFKSVAAGF